jgi:hypothetical protein
MTESGTGPADTAKEAADTDKQEEGQLDAELEELASSDGSSYPNTVDHTTD